MDANNLFKCILNLGSRAVNMLQAPRYLHPALHPGNIVWLSPTKSCSLLVSEVIFQFPITTLWRDCRQRRDFKFPHLPPQMHSWRNRGLHLWIADGGDYEISHETLCRKPERGLWWRARRQMSDGFDRFCAFHGSIAAHISVATGVSLVNIGLLSFQHHITSDFCVTVSY